MKVRIFKFTYPDTESSCWRLEYQHEPPTLVADRPWWTWHRDYIRRHDALRGARALAKRLGQDPQSLEVESS